MYGRNGKLIILIRNILHDIDLVIDDTNWPLCSFRLEKYLFLDKGENSIISALLLTFYAYINTNI